MKWFPTSRDWGLCPRSFLTSGEENKGEVRGKARLAIWKGGAFPLPLIARSPRPAVRLELAEMAGAGVGGGREPGEPELHNKTDVPLRPRPPDVGDRWRRGSLGWLWCTSEAALMGTESSFNVN